MKSQEEAGLSAEALLIKVKAGEDVSKQAVATLILEAEKTAQLVDRRVQTEVPLVIPVPILAPIESNESLKAIRQLSALEPTHFIDESTAYPTVAIITLRLFPLNDDGSALD